MENHKAATLARLGVHPDLYAELTDAQIDLIYCHPADEKGALLLPPIPQKKATLEEDLAAAEMALQAFSVPPEQATKALDAIRERHNGVTRGSHGDR